MLPIVEGLYDMGNLAAVCRTSDGVPVRRCNKTCAASTLCACSRFSPGLTGNCAAAQRSALAASTL